MTFRKAFYRQNRASGLLLFCAGIFAEVSILLVTLDISEARVLPNPSLGATGHSSCTTDLLVVNVPQAQGR